MQVCRFLSRMPQLKMNHFADSHSNARKIMHRNRLINSAPRTLVVAAASFLIATVSLAQPDATTIKLEVTGLTKKTAVLQLLSADLINVSSEEGARTKRSSTGKAYRITRTMDSRSTRIREAAESGKILRHATIKFDGNDVEAQGVKVALGRAYITDYAPAPTSGGNATESFLLHFMSTSTDR